MSVHTMLRSAPRLLTLALTPLVFAPASSMDCGRAAPPEPVGRDVVIYGGTAPR